MTKEACVSFETAKLLKEKGFDWECLARYDKPIFSNNVSIFTEVNAIDWNTYYYGSDYKFSAPTQQMACSWLREEHKIHITTEPLEMFKEERIVYEPTIYLLNDFDDFALEYETVHLKECDTNEDAIEAALEYALTKLI